jgi:hypothetical protein
LVPPGKEFEFIVEKDKVDKVKRVISHNSGAVVDERAEYEDVRMRVRKIGTGEEP